MATLDPIRLMIGVAFLVLLLLVAVAMGYCVKRGWAVYLLLTCTAIGAGACVWVGVYQATTAPLISQWSGVALAGVGLTAAVAVAAVGRRISSTRQVAAA